MELNEFITKTLIDISKGVWEAQRECVNNGTFINPSTSRSGHSVRDANETPLPVTTIEFEIGLTVTQGNENSFGIGVLFGDIGLGGKHKNSNENKSITNIKFSVPLALSAISTNKLIQKTNG